MKPDPFVFALRNLPEEDLLSKSVMTPFIPLSNAFRGRYLLTDEPLGILGRDVLNSLVLTFDDPAQQWSIPTLRV